MQEGNRIKTGVKSWTPVQVLLNAGIPHAFLLYRQPGAVGPGALRAAADAQHQLAGRERHGGGVERAALRRVQRRRRRQRRHPTRQAGTCEFQSVSAICCEWLLCHECRQAEIRPADKTGENVFSLVVPFGVVRALIKLSVDPSSCVDLQSLDKFSSLCGSGRALHLGSGAGALTFNIAQYFSQVGLLRKKHQEFQ